MLEHQDSLCDELESSSVVEAEHAKNELEKDGATFLQFGYALLGDSL